MLNPSQHIYRYQYMGRTYMVREAVNIKGKQVITAHAHRR